MASTKLVIGRSGIHTKVLWPHTHCSPHSPQLRSPFTVRFRAAWCSRPPCAVLPQVVYHNLSGLTPVCTHRHLPKFKSLFKVRPANAFQCFQTQNKLFGKVFKVWMAWPLLPFQVWNVISVHQPGFPSFIISTLSFTLGPSLPPFHQANIVYSLYLCVTSSSKPSLLIKSNAPIIHSQDARYLYFL